jgi:hypothetical protein
MGWIALLLPLLTAAPVPGTGAAAPSSITSSVIVAGQKPTVADVAVALSGTWRLNRELSPQVTAPGGPPGGGRRGGRPSFALGALAAQRGGGGGGGRGGDSSPSSAQDLTPEELAGQAALRQLQQVAEVITIKAAADSVTFSDPRGERTYAIDGKTARLAAGGATLAVKTKWDKLTLRQEFSIPTRKLIQTWDVDASGRLLLKVRLESMTLNTPDVVAVFDRQ